MPNFCNSLPKRGLTTPPLLVYITILTCQHIETCNVCYFMGVVFSKVLYTLPPCLTSPQNYSTKSGNAFG